MVALNAQSPVPLYHQLADVLLERIQTGDYPTGSRIPSEPELARSFGIGRPTVRQATDLLVRKHRLERRRGSGTYVVEPPEQADLLSLAGTLASFEKGGVAARTSLLQRPSKVEVPSASHPSPFAGRDALFVSRLSRVRKTPVLLEELYFDPELFKGLLGISLAGRSISQIIEQHFHMRPRSADQNFRVARLDAERAATLELRKGEPILLVRRTLHFEHAKSAIHAELYCRTDQMVFSQTLGDIDA